MQTTPSALTPAALETLEPRLMLSSTTWLAADAPVRAYVPTSSTVAAGWQNAAFDDSAWLSGTGGVGYDRGEDYDALIGLDVESVMYAKNGTCYIRMPFTVDTLNDLTSVQLMMQYDDGFVAYINGVEVARSYAPETLAWNSQAAGIRADADAMMPEAFALDIGELPLVVGNNVLAIHGLNLPSSSSDFLIRAELVAGSTQFPQIQVDGATEVRTVQARLNGTLVDDGDGTTAIFVAYGTADGGTDPTAWDNVVPLGNAAEGAFSYLLRGLDADTTYHYTVFAQNERGVAWGNSTSFTTTNAPLAAVETLTASIITPTSAQLNGRVTDVGDPLSLPQLHIVYGSVDGGDDPLNWQHDVLVGTQGLGLFATNATELVPNGTYYYRVYAENAGGIAWGADTISFTTLPMNVEGETAPEALWIEGEDYVSTTFNRHGWYSNVRTDQLSGNQWVAHYAGTGKLASSTYSLVIEEGGTFDLWLRINPFRNGNGGGDYNWRVQNDQGVWSAWTNVDMATVSSSVNIALPNIDIRNIGWAQGGQIELAPGEYTLEVQLGGQTGLTDREVHGGIDVMALVNYPWAPTGVQPPSTQLPTPGADEWFALQAGPDAFSPSSIIDMRYLLDDYAGIHGHLTQQADQFVFADGTPVKFWGIVAGQTATEDSMRQQAQFYAKHGINMVRQHPVQGVVGQLQGSRETGYYLNPANLDRFDKWFAILKENGIYMTWSLFYHHRLPNDAKESLGGTVPDALFDELNSKAGLDTYGYATFIQEYQDSQWEYANLLLNHVNPYTGLRYADDPALAIVEARNEDSVFFHNPLGHNFVHGNDAPAHRERLREMWHDWVAATYATDADLAAAWGAGKRAADSVTADPATQPMKMYAAWEMNANGPFGAPNEKARMGDFIRFLAEMQRDTYETYYGRLRTIGYNAVIMSTAWRAGGPAADPANTWTDDAMDAITRHNYVGGGDGGHNITTGTVNNFTHMSLPGSGFISSGMYQVEDKPFVMTEWTQKPPNQWKAEAAPIFAFYGMGLQGWDASYQFAGGRSYMGNGWPGLRAYVTETPHYIGQFPALSFAIYNNHITEGSITAARRVSTDDLFQGIDVLSQDFTGGGWDDKVLIGDLATPTQTLAIGRVTFKAGENLPHSYAQDWSQYWDQQNKVVTSNTGQLKWDYDDRVISVGAQKTQAIIGFAGGGTYDLPGVSVSVQTGFVSLIFTALDNKPLTQSGNILITAMAQDKQYGAVYNASGTELIEIGTEPLMLEPVQATITFKDNNINQANVVDVFGVPTSTQVPITGGRTIHIDGTYATYYYQVTRSGVIQPPQLAGDANRDGLVDDRDLNIVLGNWGLAGATWAQGDFNGDGSVDDRDLNTLLGNWADGVPAAAPADAVLAAPAPTVESAAPASQPVLSASPSHQLAARPGRFDAWQADLLAPQAQTGLARAIPGLTTASQRTPEFTQPFVDVLAAAGLAAAV